MESTAVPVEPMAPEGSAPGDKGLKKNAIGFVSSIVIGVASTAPGYSLAATLGFIVAVVGFGAPAILLISFVPMFLVAGGYNYMNRADPDCGTTFTWVTKAMGPRLGWLAGWAIVVADVIVMANLAQIAGLYTFLLFDANSPPTRPSGVTFVGVIWIVIMTSIVTIGIELSARTQVGPAGGRGHHARGLRGRGAGQGLLRQRTEHFGASEPQLDHPVRDQHQRDHRRHAARRVHLLGLGHDRIRQRGNRGLDRGAGQGDGRQHADPARDLRDRGGRGTVLRRARRAEAQQGRRAERTRRRGFRLPARQDPDHRRAHVGVGLDPDDDPADRPHDAFDGPREGHAERVGKSASALPDARLSRPSRWAWRRSFGMSR